MQYCKTHQRLNNGATEHLQHCSIIIKRDVHTNLVTTVCATLSVDSTLLYL